MPISEDEFDHVRSANGMTKAELRRCNKPIMEKKRRARINNCLNELKSLILDALNKDPARHSKLEKADILEMTVKHLQAVQRQQVTSAVTNDAGVMQRFRSGFSECAGEVNRFVGRLPGVDQGVKQRLMGHLASCVTGIPHVNPNSTIPPTQQPPQPQIQHQPSTSAVLPPTSPVEDLNNNGSRLQMYPSRLASGELALVLPLQSPTHASAFTAVTRSSVASLSPPLQQPTPVSPLHIQTNCSPPPQPPQPHVPSTLLQPIAHVKSIKSTPPSPPQSPPTHVTSTTGQWDALDFSYKSAPKRCLDVSDYPPAKRAKLSPVSSSSQASQDSPRPSASSSTEMWRPW